MEYRTKRIWVNSPDPETQVKVAALCRAARQLYNTTLAIVRSEFFQNGRLISYLALWNRVKTKKWFQKIREILPAQPAQQVLKLVEENWKSYFSSLNDFQNKPWKYQDQPNPPGFKKGSGYILPFTKQHIRRDGTNLWITAKRMTIVEIQLPSDWSHLSFQQVRLHSPLPSGGFWVELVYKKEFQPTSFPGGFRKAGLDLGLNNLAALVSTVYGVKPVIVKGGALSSKLHFYRREQDRLRTQYARQGIKTGSALNRLCAKHDRQMADFLHKLSRFIIDWCVTHQLDELVVGLNWGWKQRSKLRRKINRRFQGFPFSRLVQLLEDKGAEVGLKVSVVPESYTSKCSFPDNEPVGKHLEYCGKRVARGLFKSASGLEINADLNGAYNIIRVKYPRFRMLFVPLHPRTHRIT